MCSSELPFFLNNFFEFPPPPSTSDLSVLISRHKVRRYDLLCFQRELFRNASATYLKLLPVGCFRIVLWMFLHRTRKQGKFVKVYAS